MSNKKNTEELYRSIMDIVTERIKEEFSSELEGSSSDILNTIKYVKFIDIILDRDGKKK
jgi:hypothetical protein